MTPTSPSAVQSRAFDALCDETDKAHFVGEWRRRRRQTGGGWGEGEGYVRDCERECERECESEGMWEGMRGSIDGLMEDERVLIWII